MVRSIILILGLMGCIRVPQEDKGNCKEINQYVQMAVTAPNEIWMNDSLYLDISFINISDSLITFYPKGFITIWKPNETYFGVRCLEHINLVRDFRTSVVIPPHEKHSSHYAIRASTSCFQYGALELQLAYAIQYEKEVKNELCGRIESNIIQILVKGELDR